MKNEKRVKDSQTTMNELVLPNDTNTFGGLMGGRLLYWMDICAAMAAQKHCNSVVVTASVDNVSFKKSIKLGEVLTIEAQVTRAFNTSIEVRMEVYGQNLPEGTKYKSNVAYYTFVAVDPEGKPRAVPKLIPESEYEKKLYEEAQLRRELRLILAGKINPKDASSLSELIRASNVK
ncbi:MAG TPA: acyl-CoA thioesterase [Sphingobacterium sp.]|nr:acyl-CoA thioesterase [Sphingobacterium sp.]